MVPCCNGGPWAMKAALLLKNGLFLPLLPWPPLQRKKLLPVSQLFRRGRAGLASQGEIFILGTLKMV